MTNRNLKWGSGFGVVGGWSGGLLSPEVHTWLPLLAFLPHIPLCPAQIICCHYFSFSSFSRSLIFVQLSFADMKMGLFSNTSLFGEGNLSLLKNIWGSKNVQMLAAWREARKTWRGLLSSLRVPARGWTMPGQVQRLCLPLSSSVSASSFFFSFSSFVPFAGVVRYLFG